MKFIKDNKKFFLIIAALAAFPVLIVLVIFCCEWKIVSLNYPNGSQWISIFGGMLAYIGTCFMGLLAFWQNIKQREENEKAQKRLDSFNNQLLKLRPSTKRCFTQRVEHLFDCK